MRKYVLCDGQRAGVYEGIERVTEGQVVPVTRFVQLALKPGEVLETEYDMDHLVQSRVVREITDPAPKAAVAPPPVAAAPATEAVPEETADTSEADEETEAPEASKPSRRRRGR